jgi:nicotinamidase-related amidase
MLEQLRKDECVLLCIDYQERLLPRIHMADEITRNATIMIRAAQALKIPIIVTEQYPEGLGRTVQNLVETLGGEYSPIEKNSFDCFKSSAFVKKLRSAKAKSLLTMGVEAHVCVYQTVLEALRRKHHVYFLEDATSSLASKWPFMKC